MIKLNVWLSLSQNQTVSVGTFVASDPDSQGRLQGQFKYSANYLNLPQAFPLDPIHLPLSQEIYNAHRPYSGVHGVFEDSLPDDWGRKILTRRYQLGRKDQRVPQLLSYIEGQGMGALSYSTDNTAPIKKEGVEGKYLEELQRLAKEFEEDATSIDAEMALLFQAGSSPGGARPKALIRDKNQAYLAKFSSIKDQFDVVALEAATMELARKAGVDTASTKCVKCGQKNILLVNRFDLDVTTMKRNHVISMQTLLHAEGFYTSGYSDMADVLRQVSNDPELDLKKLFEQLLFNVMVGNTDDHLKNFCMLFDGKEWKLSPAFDLLPNIGLNQEHILRIDQHNIILNRQSLIQEAKNFGIKQKSKAIDIIEKMFKSVSNWESVFKDFEVPRKDIEIIGKDITCRLEKIQT